jgi:hypothetical protein
MSINPKDYGWQDQYSDAAPLSGLIAQNSNHIRDYMLTRPKYINPLQRGWPGIHRYNPRLSFGSEQLLNAGIYSTHQFNPVGLDQFSKQLDDKNKAIVNSAVKF